MNDENEQADVTAPTRGFGVAVAEERAGLNEEAHDENDDMQAGQAEQADESLAAASGVNVGGNERAWSMAAGAVLAVYGLTRITTARGLLAAVAGGALAYRGMSGQCSLYRAMNFSTARKDDEGAEPADYYQRGIQVRRSQTISRPAAELYSYWRDFQNLPKFMSHLKEVRVLDNNTSRWVAKGPMGMSVEWTAEIINDEENRVLAWKSVGENDVDNSGSVRFVESPDLRATEVTVTIDYIPPAGKVGSMIAKLFGEEPEQQITDDLRRFKQLMETGEIATTEGQPRGQCAPSAY